MTQSSRAFLKRKGSIKVGPGDPVEDVRKARELMGTEILLEDGRLSASPGLPSLPETRKQLIKRLAFPRP